MASIHEDTPPSSANGRCHVIPVHGTYGAGFWHSCLWDLLPPDRRQRVNRWPVCDELQEAGATIHPTFTWSGKNSHHRRGREATRGLHCCPYLFLQRPEIFALLAYPYMLCIFAFILVICAVAALFIVQMLLVLWILFFNVVRFGRGPTLLQTALLRVTSEVTPLGSWEVKTFAAKGDAHSEIHEDPEVARAIWDFLTSPRASSPSPQNSRGQ